MLTQGERETVGKALAILQGETALFFKATDALRAVLEHTVPAPVVTPAPSYSEEVPREEPASESAPPPRGYEAKPTVRETKRTSSKTPTPKKAPKGRQPSRSVRGSGGTSAAILAALAKHPSCDLDAICKEVYGATGSKHRRRLIDMCQYLQRTGRVVRGAGKYHWALPDRKAVIAAVAQAKPGPKPRRGTKEASPASIKATAARKAGRANNASPPMFRCNVCAGLMFERQRVEHMLGAHGVAIEEHDAAKYFKLVEDRGE